LIRIIEEYLLNEFYSRTSSQGSTSAAMEGKLKEKLESMGLAFLCLSTGYLSPFEHWCKLRIVSI
jgi:hypothetical protein